MGHGCRQTLLRVETCAHHVLTETYDKRIITGLKIYSLVGNIKNDFVKYFMQHIRNGLFIDLINS